MKVYPTLTKFVKTNMSTAQLVFLRLPVNAEKLTHLFNKVTLLSRFHKYNDSFRLMNAILTLL